MPRHLSSILLAFLSGPVLLGAAAASPAVAGVYYRAEPAAPNVAERLVVRELVWKCGPGACVAGPSSSRPTVDCSALAREVGGIRSFSVEGRVFSPDQLEKCNLRAR